MDKRRPVVGAPIVMRKKGELTDSLVLEEVRKRPGSTIREIAIQLNMTTGRVDGSVNRLLSQGKVKVRHFLKKGILIKRVYPIEYIPKTKDIIEIPRELVDDSLWKEEAYVYALSRSTIGVSPQDVEEWEKKSILKKKVPIFKKEESLIVKIPSPISEFYELENSEVSLSALDNLVLLTIEPILPVVLPSTYPEETTVKITRRLIEIQKIKEETISLNPSYPFMATDISEEKGKKILIPYDGAYPSAPSKVSLIPEISSGTNESSSKKVEVEVR